MKLLELVRFALLAVCVASTPGAAVQSGEALQEAYERAAFIENNAVNRYHRNALVTPAWIGDTNDFWFRHETADGFQFIRVDATDGSKAPLFDHTRLAELLQDNTGRKINPEKLPLRGLAVDPDGSMSFAVFEKGFAYSADGGLSDNGTADSIAGLVMSPDGTMGIFLRDHNLWVKDIASGAERALTTDGSAYYAYAMAPDANRDFSAGAHVIWSPDSSRLLTIQTDDRQVAELPVVQFAPTVGVRPSVISKRVALPGDAHLPTFAVLTIDVATGKQTRMHYPDIPAVRMLDTPIAGNRAWWAADNETVYFVDITRGEQRAIVVEGNAVTGRARAVFEETSETYLELGQNVYLPAALAYLDRTNQLVWYSEKSGWAHLYLYDLETGEEIRALTSGDWVVRDILHVDQNRRDMLISIAGRDPDKNPYYQEVARVDLDTGRMDIVSAGDDNRTVVGNATFEAFGETVIYKTRNRVNGVSKDGDYFVETRTRPDRLSATYIKRRDGTNVAPVIEATLSGMPEGFTLPEPVQLTAADGETRIEGLVFRPSDFSPDKTYPIIDHIYGGPQIAHIPTTFTGPAMVAQAVSELGFIVVIIDGRGTTGRSKAFHETSRGAAERASDLRDHVAGIRQLAERYPYIDGDRVGIFGFSGGGYMTARAMLDFGDVFDVGVSGAGNHDQRLFWHGWGERYQGLVDGDNYLAQANLSAAGGLQGKLLFIHGMLDIGVHPGGLFQLTQALMDANKDFDMLLLPRAGHVLPGYGLVKQWDYFVEHLAGKTPPADFKTLSSSDSLLMEVGGLFAGEPVDDETGEDQ